MKSNTCVVSKSLIRTTKPNLSKEEERRFCLGLVGWCPCSNCSPMETKSLILKRKRRGGPVTDGEVREDNPSPESLSNNDDKDERFDFNVTSEDLSKYMEGETPVNTEKSTAWAVNNFEAWRMARNKEHSDDPCPENVFVDDDKSVICKWLCKFLTETRKSNGEEYTPRSLYLLLSGLQRHMRKLKPLESINVFQDVHYKPLKNVCDSIFKRLHQKGIGTETKQTPVLSPDDEAKLWETIIDINSPKGLLRAVFFCNGKNFCLRGGQEQRDLKLSQLTRETKLVDGKALGCYVYCENGSKNRPGNFASLNLENKVVHQFENVKNPEKCHVRILDKYLSLIPQEAYKSDVFYLTPLASKPADPSKPWFTTTPIGRNKLGVMLKQMCQDAGIDGRYSNHSLRAAGATTMFQAGVPEKLMQQRTGHRSIEGLRRYERTSETQLVDISNVVANNEAAATSSVAPPEKNVVPVQENSCTLDLANCGTSKLPSIVLKGCTFTGCSLAFSGPASNVNNESVAAEVLNGIDINAIFED